MRREKINQKSAKLIQNLELVKDNEIVIITVFHMFKS